MRLFHRHDWIVVSTHDGTVTYMNFWGESFESDQTKIIERCTCCGKTQVIYV